MIEIDQATVNLHYVKAQQRRITKLKRENNQLRELIETLREWILAKKREGKLQ